MKFLIICLMIEGVLVLFLVITIIKESHHHKLKHAESSTWTYGEAESGLQTHHVYYMLKRRRNNLSHVVSTWNTRGVCSSVTTMAPLW